MFYRCPKCKKIWQYPIAKCPDCFLELERQDISTKIKVIGVSKVSIPTLLHPKTPFFALVLEDENKNKWVYKSVKEYKIGDDFKIEAKKDKNAVAMLRIKYDILEAIEKANNLISGINLNQNTKVLVLPTLIAPKHPYFCENTRPRFLEAIIQFLIQKGVKPNNIKVVSQSFDELPIEASAQKSGLYEVCQRNKIDSSDLSKSEFVKKTKDKFNFEIAKDVFDSDIIINLPILKMGRTSAAANILKFLKKENYLGLKYLYSDEEVIKNLNEVLPNYFTIADAEIIQKPDKFTAFFGLIFAGFNALNLERVFFEATGQKKGNLPEILKDIKIEDVPIAGREIDEVQYDVEKV